MYHTDCKPVRLVMWSILNPQSAWVHLHQTYLTNEDLKMWSSRHGQVVHHKNQYFQNFNLCLEFGSNNKNVIKLPSVTSHTSNTYKSFKVWKMKFRPTLPEISVLVTSIISYFVKVIKLKQLSWDKVEKAVANK
jgi:hypothetical protein